MVTYITLLSCVAVSWPPQWSSQWDWQWASPAHGEIHSSSTAHSQLELSWSSFHPWVGRTRLRSIKNKSIEQHLICMAECFPIKDTHLLCIDYRLYILMIYFDEKFRWCIQMMDCIFWFILIVHIVSDSLWPQNQPENMQCKVLWSTAVPENTKCMICQIGPVPLLSSECD